MKAVIDLDLYVGVTAFNVRSYHSTLIVVGLPIDRIVLATNSPFNDMINNPATCQHIRTFFRQTNRSNYNPSNELDAESLIDDRNEPCKLTQLAEIVAGFKVLPLEEVIKTTYKNTLSLLGFSPRHPNDLKRVQEGEKPIVYPDLPDHKELPKPT
jgi:Tat protein secretion system quality control protein TatD with DNase activity